MLIVYVLSKATFVLQWQSRVAITETIWFAKPYCFLSGPFQKMLAIPAAEHAFLSTTLISRSFVLILHFLFLSFHVHVVITSCNFSWKMFQMWLFSYHWSCLRLGSCPLFLGLIKYPILWPPHSHSRFWTHCLLTLPTLFHITAHAEKTWYLYRTLGQMDVFAWGLLVAS